MDINEIRRINLKNLIEESGGRQAFIEKTGKNDSQVSQLLSTAKSSRNIGNKLAREIEEKCGKDPGWLDTAWTWVSWNDAEGNTVMRRGPGNLMGSRLARKHQSTNAAQEDKVFNEDITKLDSALYSHEVVGWESEGDLPQDQFVFIPRLEVELSAGNGNMVWEVTEKGEPQAFRLEWLQKKGLRSKDLRCLYAQGDSMEPYIQDGDAILVDLSDTDIMDNQVYAIRYGDDLRVKRLFKRFDRSIRITSDNPAHPEEIVSGEDLHNIQILGKVVWRGG
jgi:phage repressor protein C with HTH and peptisase S24 domain